jgi:hypothetical protein
VSVDDLFAGLFQGQEDQEETEPSEEESLWFPDVSPEPEPEPEPEEPEELPLVYEVTLEQLMAMTD